MKVISIGQALGRRMTLALSLCSVLLGTASAASSNKLTGPTNLFICPGATGQFSATASGPTPYAFKWLKNGTLLAGKTSNSLTISNATTSDAGTYTVILTGGANSVTNSATLTLKTNVSATPLVSLVRAVGANAVFSTSASGTGPFTYLWKKNGNPISGQTTSSLTLVNVGTNSSGVYSVAVSGACSSAEPSATLTVAECFPALDVMLVIDRSGSMQGAPYNDARLACSNFVHNLKLTSTTTNSDQAALASYNSAATLDQTLTNRMASLEQAIAGIPAATGNTSITLGLQTGRTELFSVRRRDYALPVIVLLSDGLPTGGDTGSNALYQATLAKNAGARVFTVGLGGVDHVLMRNLASSTNDYFYTTNSAQLTALFNAIATVICRPPTNVIGPTSLILCPGATANFSVTATGCDAFSYQWFKDGALLGGQTSESLTRANVSSTDAGIYSVAVSSACLTVTNSATLTVNTNLTAIGPFPQTNCIGGAVVFSTAASGTGPITYQWFKNGVLLTNQTAATLTLNSISAGAAANYGVTVSGACGAPVTNSASLTVAPLPTITAPANQIVESGAPWTFGTPTANYPISIISTVTNSAGTCGTTFSATRTWRATDACGNFTDAAQTITVVDTTAPTLTCVANRSVECGAAWSFDPPTASDGTVTVLSTTTNAACGNSFAATRTWVATDACGNTTQCAQTVTVHDTTAPSLACGANKSVEAGAHWDFDAPTASDVCGTNTISILSTLTNATCGNTYTATRTWQATDACGNTAQCSQTVTVHDTTAPSLTCGANKTVECGSAWTFDLPTATDIGGTNAIAVANTVTNATCGNTLSATRTWTATDACGNVAQCSQTVTIIDTTAPTITCIADKTIEAGAAWTFDVPTATDICGTNVITILGTTTNAVGACGTTFTATRTWQATDACGSSAQCSQTVTIVDTTAPTITCVGNRTVECGGAWTFDAPTASDGTVSVLSTTTNAACGNTLSATRTWTATDACGNVAQCSQTVTVMDTTAPTILCLANKTIETGVAWDFDAPSAIDVCGTNSITILSTTTNSACGNTFTATRTWQATDACGNTAQCNQTVTVHDFTAPTLNCVANKTVECGSVWTFDAPSATDIGGTNTITILSTVTNAACGKTFSTTRTWTATDACGNVAQCSQTVTVADTTAPVITCTVNKFVEAGVAWDFDPPTAADGCGTNTITILSTTTNALCGNTFTATRIWQVTDACGNTAQCSQAVTVHDFTAPTLNCVANKTVECGSAWTFDAPNATDIGGTNAITILSTVTNAGCGNTFSTTRTWTATDACGNASQCAQTVTVVDTTAPMITCVGNKTVETGAAWNFDAPTTTDVCGTNAISIVSTTTNANCGNTFTATRTWKATDACGNTAECSQTVTVNDSTAPTLICVASKTVECGSAWDFDAPSATDIGGSNSLAVLNTVTNAACGYTFSATRTWTATDACGNVAQCSQTVTIVDTTVPVIACAANKTVEAGAAWDFDAPTAADGCGTNSIQLASTITNSLCGSTFTATRTWQATDACGNTAECSQTVTVNDTTAPTLTCVAGKTVECGSAWTFDAPAASDGTIAVVSTTTNAACGQTFRATRTWSATDTCGNVAQCAQTVTVIDTTAPVITCAANKTVESGAAWTFDAPMATDVCGTNSITVVSTTTNSVGACGSTFTATRTWQATDACGNTAQCSQTVTVVDTTAPGITCVAGKSVEKGANWSFDPPTVSEGTLSIVSTVTNDLGCAVNATRTWQVVDSCGNVAQCSQTVSFVDTTAPVVVIVSPTNGAVFIAPANFTVVANVQDVGGPIALVEFFSGTNKLGEAASDQAFLVLTNVAIGSYNFTARATDNCGNATTSVPVVVNVIERPPLTILSNLRINPATSLWEQKVRVTNPTYSTFDAVRVYVQGLPASVAVFNASGAKAGVPYVQTPTAIPPNSYVDFVIEYYTTSGSVPAPTLRAELVQATGGGGAASLFGTQQRINRALMLPNRQFIVEFATLAGRTYAVQYSADLTSWQTAQGGITGNGSWYQWVDGGLPKTESAPRDTRLRFYRVILLP